MDERQQNIYGIYGQSQAMSQSQQQQNQQQQQQTHYNYAGGGYGQQQAQVTTSAGYGQQVAGGGGYQQQQQAYGQQSSYAQQGSEQQQGYRASAGQYGASQAQQLQHHQQQQGGVSQSLPWQQQQGGMGEEQQRPKPGSGQSGAVQEYGMGVARGGGMLTSGYGSGVSTGQMSGGQGVGGMVGKLGDYSSGGGQGGAYASKTVDYGMAGGSAGVYKTEYTSSAGASAVPGASVVYGGKGSDYAGGYSAGGLSATSPGMHGGYGSTLGSTGAMERSGGHGGQYGQQVTAGVGHPYGRGDAQATVSQDSIHKEKLREDSQQTGSQQAHLIRQQQALQRAQALAASMQQQRQTGADVPGRAQSDYSARGSAGMAVGGSSPGSSEYTASRGGQASVGQFASGAYAAAGGRGQSDGGGGGGQAYGAQTAYGATVAGRSVTVVSGGAYGSQQAQGGGAYSSPSGGRAYAGASYAGVSQGQQYGSSAQQSGYGGVALPPGRDYSASRTAGSREQSHGSGRAQDSTSKSNVASRHDDRRDERSTKRDTGRDREADDRRRDDDKRRDTHRDHRDARDRRDDDRRKRESPPRSSRDRKDSPPKRDDRSARKDSPRRDLSYRHSSPSIKEKRREYVCKIETYNLVEVERDYQSVCRRYARMYISPEFSKVVACWVGNEVEVPLDKPVSFEHEAIDVEDDGETKDAASKLSEKVAAPSSLWSASSSAIKPPKMGPTVWNAKVMLMSGLDVNAQKDLSSDKAADEKILHLHKLIGFVTLRKDRERSAIMSVGGTWDKELDGGDPEVDDSVLIRTAIRCTKEMVQVDLSECTSWMRFMEVHYERAAEDGGPSHKEITVVYIPDVHRCIPSAERWKEFWNERLEAKRRRESEAKDAKSKEEARVKADLKTKDNAKSKSEGVDKVAEANGEKKEVEKEREVDEKDRKPVVEEPPTGPAVVVSTKRTKLSKIRSMSISLDGLLDYLEDDREECTFELSLFAELFQEMLQRKFGMAVYNSLVAVREGLRYKRKDDRKRPQETKIDSRGGRKKTKFDIEPTDEVKADVKTDKPVKVEKDDKTESSGKGTASTENVGAQQNGSADAENMKEADKKKDTDVEMSDPAKNLPKEEDKKKDEKKERELPAKVETRRVVDYDLLKAYYYFDRNRVGYLKLDDLRRLLHGLGLFLSHRNVKDLVSYAIMESSKSRDDRVMYRAFTDRDEAVEVKKGV